MASLPVIMALESNSCGGGGQRWAKLPVIALKSSKDFEGCPASLQLSLDLAVPD